MEDNFLQNPIVNQELSLSGIIANINTLSATPKDFFRNILSDNLLFESIVKFFVSFEREIVSALLAAEDRGVSKRNINQIIRMVKDEVKSKSGHAKTDSKSVPVKSTMQNAPVANDAVLPAGYHFTGSLGISHSKEDNESKWIVSICPIFITEILHNPVQYCPVKKRLDA